MKVKLITKTIGVDSVFSGKSLDEIIVGQARVSTSRETQELFDTPEKLIRHCILNQHWSIFELANLGFKIETTRAIGREILRHGKMTGLTEFSQRYSNVTEAEVPEIRSSHKSNRQSSTDRFDGYVVLQDGTQIDANEFARDAIDSQLHSYDLLLNAVNVDGKKVASETARMILPEATKTTIYLNFRIRELITFLNARLHQTAQKEIVEIANEMAEIFIEHCPIIAKSLFNFKHAYKSHILEQIVLEKYGLRDYAIENHKIFK